MRTRMVEKPSLTGRAFDTLNIAFLTALIGTMVLPLLNTLALSMSSGLASMTPDVVFWPREFSLEGYRIVWLRNQLWLPFWNNTIVTVLGTLAHVVLSAMAGYVLVQRELPGKNWMVSGILVTMMIPGETILIPLYIVNKELGLLNTLTSLIVSGLVSGFSILLMRNYFSAVPHELAESARMDGANDLRIFLTIYLPLSGAGLATVTLFEFVSKWNHFMSAVLYIKDSAKYTLQIALRAIILENPTVSSNFIITKNVRMAGVIIAMLPLVIIYPFVQRFFIRGIMLGSVKE